ncbi:MAG: DUF975 family protein [Clostridia bacterium]|nr:DUF975 family protein [Clostridia bacterium]
MDLTSSTLKNRAKNNLRNVYGISIVVTMLYTAIISALSSGGTLISMLTGGLPYMREIFEAVENGNVDALFSSNVHHFNISFTPFSSIGTVGLFVLAGPLTVGVAQFFLHVADRNDPQINDLFAHFKNLGNTLVLYLLTTLFTFLWSLLFIIPGIIAGISYAMAPYILAEHPEIKASDAIKMSKQMMQGHKGEYFVLQLSFVGWCLLCLITCGIGFIFLSPYMSTANAEFFNEVSGKNTEKRLNGIDVDGAAAYGSPNGYARPGYTGYAQPDNNGYNGYAQPDNTTGYSGYTQPDNTTGYSGYAQPNADAHTGYPRQDDPGVPPADPYGGNG